MKNFTRSVFSRSPRSSGLLARAIRLVTGRGKVVGRPSSQWTLLGPIDFEGEDTSLTQAHLELLR